MLVTFPHNPVTGQEWVGPNSVTYQWSGTYWSTKEPMVSGRAIPIAEGGDAFHVFEHLRDGLLDGGNAYFDPTLDVNIPRYHWVRDKPDTRDYIYSLEPRAVIPSKVDLRPYASTIEDQSIIGSCVGNAVAGAIELVDRKNSKLLEVSRLFIYYQARVYEGSINYDNGAYIRDGFKAVNQYGAPLESIWPYDVTKWSVRPTTAAYTDAAKRKVKVYQRCLNFQAVKNALAAGNPVVVGFDVYQKIGRAHV